MKKDRRWLKSAIATASTTEVVMPWTRGQRRRPEAMMAEALKAQPAKPAASQANAAR
ncbi:MAG: hypothetical protein JNN06_16440 [Gemmobacter sp.]|uniref:hypothetical protein n=1 Tax=Gemmobacter sp. TaxID=1898957 RepID=UPI001A63A093|nr:hypothetical protein [Gemmobacter sp.]MBL8563858.1 hypothetical protein [Gemmobacter sp.]